MKKIFYTIFLTIVFSIIQTVNAQAQQQFAYGFSGVVYDSVNNRVKGYSRTEIDYNTGGYYTPYVCGSLYANGVEQIRKCYGGIVSATTNTQITGSPNTAQVVSDHYVDIYFYDEETQAYIDYYGYGFLPGYTYPLSNYFNAPNSYTMRYSDSIRVGSTEAQTPKPTVTIEGYTFRSGPELSSQEKYTVPKTSGQIWLHATISSTNSVALSGATAYIDLIKTTVTPNGLFSYTPVGQSRAVTLVSGDSVDAVFGIVPSANNGYTGDITYRLIISEVIKDATSITSTITLNPGAGLNTTAANKILKVVP